MELSGPSSSQPGFNPCLRSASVDQAIKQIEEVDMSMKYLATALMFAAYMLMLVGSGGESSEDRAAKITSLKSATPAQVDAKELAAMFKMGSENTDLQRDAKEKELAGTVVEWKVQVYEVGADGDSCYKIQTSATDTHPGTFIMTCNDDDPGVAALVPGLKTKDVITVKGVITETSMRNFRLDPAIVTK
jgi:hypothetical protein